jgi:hypothetical protein
MLARNHTHYAALIAILAVWILFGLASRIPPMLKLIRVFVPLRRHFAIEYNNNYGMRKRQGWTIVICGQVVCQFERYLLWALARAFAKYMFWPSDLKGR